jgi:hypothetical protein
MQISEGLQNLILPMIKSYRTLYLLVKFMQKFVPGSCGAQNI